MQRMLSFIWPALILHQCWLNIASAQLGPPKCVPVGLCFPQIINVNPRIVTPGEDGPPSEGNTEACKPGYELCHPREGGVVCGKRYAAHISNDNGPTSMGSHPWQVYMMDKGQYIGSGVLLNAKIVLTAAHKVFTNINTPENIKIYTGVNNPTGIETPPASRSEAELILLHEKFKFRGPTVIDYKNDIALVLLDTAQLVGYRIDLNFACLPSSTDSFLGNDNCIVGGWGETEFKSGDEGKIHKQVRVPIVSIERCKQSMMRPTVLGVESTAKYLDEKNELCAGGQAHQDACTQDGGAPLMCLDPRTGRYVTAGLVIWGKGCGRPGVYGVYVDVSKYTGWISEKINRLLARK